MIVYVSLGWDRPSGIWGQKPEGPVHFWRGLGCHFQEIFNWQISAAGYRCSRSPLWSLQLCFIPFVRGKHCISLQGEGQSMIRSSARWGGGSSGPRRNGPDQVKTAALLFLTVSQSSKLCPQKSCWLWCQWLQAQKMDYVMDYLIKEKYKVGNLHVFLQLK